MAQTENSIEFVELLDVPVYDDTDSQCVQIVENDENMSEMMITDDNQQMDEVEYIEAEELDENHTIIVHEGKQYVIPTDQLQQAGNTIILEGESDENSQENNDAVYVNSSEDDNVYFGDVNSDVSQHYAVLKDGKLHINDDNTEMQDKLRVLEQSLNNFDSNEEENDENESSQEEDELLSQITGKNLLTGQKISLTGFLEKLKNKNVNSVSQTRRKSHYSQSQGDYVLVPPVNRRVVVGKTPDGKKLIGRILQIQKKISNVDVAQYTPRKQTQRKTRRRISTETAASVPTFSTQNLPKCSALLDENVARTLAGLMDLETVCKSLIGRRLVVRHVQRRSIGGKSLSSSRKVTYYTGKMVRNADNNWMFNADEPTKNTEKDDNTIDLNIDSTDTQQLEVNISETGVVFNNKEEEIDNSEPIILYLTVTQDEFGKKRTKVSIPQLASTNCVKKVKNDENTSNRNQTLNECNICNKKFQTAASLKRHASIHDPSLRPLQCMQCLARFADESSLKKHLVLHSGVRPHICNICGKNFAHRGDLNFHLRTHNPTKQYKCDICAKTFHRHSNLLRHIDIHKQTEVSEGAEPENGATGSSGGDSKAPYVCDTCGCQYNFVSSLTRHIVTHHMKLDDNDDDDDDKMSE